MGFYSSLPLLLVLLARDAAESSYAALVAVSSHSTAEIAKPDTLPSAGSSTPRAAISRAGFDARIDRHDVEAEATPAPSSAVTMIGRTLRVVSCSQSGVEASSKLINAAWIFLHRAHTRAPAGLTTCTEAP